MAGSISFDSIVKAQGGVAINPQTGAKTYAAGYQPATLNKGDAVLDSRSHVTGGAAIGPIGTKGNPNLFAPTVTPPQLVPSASAPLPAAAIPPGAITPPVAGVSTTPLSLNPSTQIDSTQLTATPRTSFDVQSLLARNDALVQQQMLALQPSKEELAAQTAYANAKTRQLALQAQAAGQYNPNNETIPLPALVGEAQSQMFSAQLAQENALTKLTLFQKDRELLQQQLQLQVQNGQFDIGIAMELEKSKKAEEAAAKQFAVDYGVTAPYYKIGQSVYQTGGGYVSEQDFFAQNPQFNHDWSKVPQGFIQNIDGLTVSQRASLDLQKEQLNSNKYQLSYNPLTGNAQIFDPKTGQTSAPGFQPAPAGGFRTDRNNNPTAMTTDVAKSMGLLEGVDYVQGDKFPGNSNLYTAKLLGDPIETTIKGIDKGGFFTAGGKPRWSYFSMPQQQWLALNHDQKVAVITQMYKTEGGSGLLVASGDTPVDALVSQIQEDPSRFTSLSDKQKVAVTARMSQLGLPIPNSTDTSKSQTGPEATKIRENSASGLRALDKVEEEIKRNSSIILLSKLPFSPGARTYRTAVNEVKDVLTRLRTGAALNESEQSFYEKQLPGAFDSDATVQYKLSLFRDLFTRLANTPSGQSAPSTNNDPLGLFK